MKINEKETAGLKVIAEAVRWWKNHKPLSQNERQHFDNPIINCTTEGEKRLARAIARFLDTENAQGKNSVKPPVMGRCSLCQKELPYPAIAGYCSKRCAEIAIINDLIINE